MFRLFKGRVQIANHRTIAGCQLQAMFHVKNGESIRWERPQNRTKFTILYGHTTDQPKMFHITHEKKYPK